MPVQGCFGGPMTELSSSSQSTATRCQKTDRRRHHIARLKPTTCPIRYQKVLPAIPVWTPVRRHTMFYLSFLDGVQ